MKWLGPRDMLPGTVHVVGSVVIGFEFGRKWWIHSMEGKRVQTWLPGFEAGEIKRRCEGKKAKR